MRNIISMSLILAGTVCAQPPQGAEALAEELIGIIQKAHGPAKTIALLMERAAELDARPEVQRILRQRALTCCVHSVDLRAMQKVLRTMDADPEFWAKSLQDVTNRQAVPPTPMAWLYLELARKATRLDQPERMHKAFASARAFAKHTADPVLQAHIAAQKTELEFLQKQWLELEDTTSPNDALGRYLCFFAGDWARGHPMLREQRLPKDNAATPQSCVSVADYWLSSIRRFEGDGPAKPFAAANITRHALAWYHRAFPLAKDADLVRICRMMSRLDDRLMAGPGPNRLRFASAGLDRVLTANGEWQVEDGFLVGRNTGLSTWCTFPHAFQGTRSITIRGGIRSVGPFNFRVQAGTFNAIFNWEVKRENHYWFGDQRRVTKPPLFQHKQEHTLRLRQMGPDVVVFLDDRFILRGPATLSGTVSVYPALGSEIFVREILVDGEVDPFTNVTAPIGRRM